MNDLPDRTKDLLLEAVTLPPRERDVFVADACGPDQTLRNRLLGMIRAYDAAGSFLSDTSAGVTGPLTPTTADPRLDAGHPGSRIGPYEILEKLGEGGFGTVHRARQHEPVKRDVAIKILKPGLDTGQVLARFEAERQALAVMSHPGIARVLDAGRAPTGQPYFVMELVDGVPITDYCRDNRLDLPARLRLFRQVCLAVEHAHQKGIIHRDLKPSNILVATVDGRPAPKVIDFGVAKAVAEPLTDRTLVTGIRQIIGTPKYMSPEQVWPEPGGVDTRADIYTLGVILYEMLTGTLPLDPDRLGSMPFNEVARMVLQEEPARPSSHVRELRGDLDWIVMRALHKSPAHRYPTASAFATDVFRFLQNRPVEAGPPTRMYHLRKFARRHRVAIVAAMLVSVSLLTGLGLFAVGWSTASRERDAATAALTESDFLATFLIDLIQSAQPAERGRDATVVELLDVASAQLQDFSDRPILESRLRNAIGSGYLTLGRPHEAAYHLERSLTLRQRETGVDRETIRVMSNYAAALNAQGRADEALVLSRRVLDLWREQGDADDYTLLGAMNNHAQYLVSVGQYQDAETLQRETLAMQRRLLGPTHPDTLGSLSNHASVLLNLGRIDEAERLQLECLEAWRGAHGPDHPGTLLADYQLGVIDFTLRRNGAAAERFARVLEGRRRVLGEASEETLSAAIMLASSLLRVGDQDAAERMLYASMETAIESLGPRHATTLTALTNLVSIYESRGWPAASADRVERIVGLLREAVRSPAANASNLNSIAWTLLTVKPEKLRDPELAMEVAIDACQYERRTGGNQLALYLDTLALARFTNGDIAGAVETQRSALAELLPWGEGYRAEMTRSLQRYEDAAAQ